MIKSNNLFLSLSILFFFLTAVLAGDKYFSNKKTNATGAPPYGESEEKVPDVEPDSWLTNWKRPSGPARVGLQVGHWKSNELPDELEMLRKNTGATGGGISEWEVNYAIAVETEKLLRKEGIEVDILPATVPQEYWADAFIAIHADGSTDTTMSGFKIAPPWRDWTRKSNRLAIMVEDSYAGTTKMKIDPNITRNMRGYYAFSWWRFDHAIHPMTSAIIVETGFLTSPQDRKIIVDTPEVSAEGIAVGIINFLRSEYLI